MAKVDLSIAIGGAAGQGIATPGDILARIFVRRGLHLNAYNAYQSIVRGGHIFLTLRTSDEPVLSFGDKLDIMIPLNQDTMNRHPRIDEIGLGGALQRRQDQARRSDARRAALFILSEGTGAESQRRLGAEYDRAGGGAAAHRRRIQNP